MIRYSKLVNRFLTKNALPLKGTIVSIYSEINIPRRNGREKQKNKNKKKKRKKKQTKEKKTIKPVIMVFLCIELIKKATTKRD